MKIKTEELTIHNKIITLSDSEAHIIAVQINELLAFYPRNKTGPNFQELMDFKDLIR